MTLFQVVGGILTFFFWGVGKEKSVIISFPNASAHLFILNHIFLSHSLTTPEVYSFLLDYISPLWCVSNSDMLSKIQC